MSNENAIELGDKVESVVTGMVGILTCRAEWLMDHTTYGVRPLNLKDGAPQELIYHPLNQLQLVEKETVK